MSTRRTRAVLRGPARRGSVYITVLGVALLVTTIGLSALLAARVEQRALGMTQSAVQADFHAQSVIELALVWLAAAPDWRSTYTHDTWTPAWTSGEISYSLKLVDEQDGDLANDPTQRVRLYGRAIVGDAVRIYSVLLQETEGASVNLLSNPGMESGTTDWSGSWCDIESHTDDQHSGSASLAVTERSMWYAGPSQTLTGPIDNGSTYDVEAWAKMSSGTSSVRFVMIVISSGSGTRYLVEGGTPVGASEWTRVSAAMTPTWMGTLSAASLRITTVGGSTDFYVDDVAMTVAGSDGEPTLIPIPGTWRREVLP